MVLMGNIVLYLGHIGYLASLFEQFKPYKEGQFSRCQQGIERDSITTECATIGKEGASSGSPLPHFSESRPTKTRCISQTGAQME